MNCYLRTFLFKKKKLHFPCNAAATCQSKLFKQVTQQENVSTKHQIVYKSKKVAPAPRPATTITPTHFYLKAN